MFIVVLGLSAYFIGNVWNRWKSSPIIVVLDSHGTSIRDIPFPGISFQNVFFVVVGILIELQIDGNSTSFITISKKFNFLTSGYFVQYEPSIEE